MKFTSIRISEDDAERIRRIQDEVRKRTGGALLATHRIIRSALDLYELKNKYLATKK